MGILIFRGFLVLSNFEGFERDWENEFLQVGAAGLSFPIFACVQSTDRVDTTIAPRFKSTLLFLDFFLVLFFNVHVIVWFTFEIFCFFFC